MTALPVYLLPHSVFLEESQQWMSVKHGYRFTFSSSGLFSYHENSVSLLSFFNENSLFCWVKAWIKMQGLVENKIKDLQV